MYDYAEDPNEIEYDGQESSWQRLRYVFNRKAINLRNRLNTCYKRWQDYKERFLELSREYSKYQKKTDVEIRRLNRKIAMLERHIVDARKRNTRFFNLIKVYKNNNRLRTKMFNEQDRRLKEAKKNTRFFTRVFKWDERFVRANGIEVLIRYVMGYEYLKAKNIINIKELVVLVAGYQLEAFKRDDIKYRFGSFAIEGFRKTALSMTRASLIKKVTHKSDLYFLTNIGHERLIGIFKIIHSGQFSAYFKEQYHESYKQQLLRERKPYTKRKVPINKDY